jgi:hypothetical protein
MENVSIAVWERNQFVVQDFVEEVLQPPFNQGNIIIIMKEALAFRSVVKIQKVIPRTWNSNR